MISLCDKTNSLIRRIRNSHYSWNYEKCVLCPIREESNRKNLYLYLIIDISNSKIDFVISHCVHLLFVVLETVPFVWEFKRFCISKIIADIRHVPAIAIFLRGW